ncbi:ORF024 [Spodoptera frugiperda granulovirus]|uniref:ORF024 n=1 Tax=Spodoptera frugiperda granulovirus TaxID=307454 RepID=A0A0C5B300_9BBAC|nr:ORF024 [Spodoptera frugiperda granulovirus]AJK91685.1 ORF024 [Spodoptera frugiperda granulovirus]
MSTLSWIILLNTCVVSFLQSLHDIDTMSQQQAAAVSLEETRKYVVESDKVISEDITFEDIDSIYDAETQLDKAYDNVKWEDKYKELLDQYNKDKEKWEKKYTELMNQNTVDEDKWTTEKKMHEEVIEVLNQKVTDLNTQLNEINNKYETLQSEHNTLKQMTSPPPTKRRRKHDSTTSSEDEEEAEENLHEKIKQLEQELEHFRSTPCEQCVKNKETITQLVKNYNTARDCAAHYKNKCQKMADEMKVTDQMWCSTVHRLTQNCRCQKVPYKR